MHASGSGLIGRERLIESSVRLARRPGTRVVTFVGRRGVGKSRLAHAVAAALDGPVHTVALDEAVDRADYLARALLALGLREPSEHAVAERLRAFGGVVVLDSCAPEVAADIVDDVLAAVPGVTLLVTAPQPLEVASEQVVVVPTLALPPEDERDPGVVRASAAVALFLSAAERAAPALRLGDDDLPTVVELCRRLDGLPEALLLAAARLGLMEPAAMLTEMGRLGAWELVGLPVEDEVRRSVALLDPQARSVVAALATTTGGARVDALAAIADLGSDGDLLTATSLLVALQLAHADTARARLSLSSAAREYAASSNTERAPFADRHAAFFTADARSFARRGHGARMDPSWLLDHGNRLAALAHLRTSGDRAGALRLGVDSMPGFEHRGEPGAGRRLLRELLGETPESTSAACIQAHLWLGRLEAELADGHRTDTARAHFETALRLARERGNLVVHLEALNAVCENQVVLSDGVDMCEAAVAEALALTGDPALEFGRSVFLCWHAANQHRRGELEASAATIAEAITIARRWADHRLLMSYAIVHWQLPAPLRRDDVGVPPLDELLDMADEQGDVRTKGWVWIVLVHSAIEEGREREAVEQDLGMLRLSRRTRQAPIARQALVATLRLLDRAPRPELSALLAGVLAQHASTIVTHLPPRFVGDLERAVVAAQEALGREAFEAHHRSGAELDLWEALCVAEGWLAQRLDELTTPGLAATRLDPTVLDDRTAPAHLGPEPPVTSPVTSPVTPPGSPPGHLHGGHGALSDLTPRELEVLEELAAGQSNKEVATRLGMRPKTVAHHCAAIYAKLGVRNRTEAVAAALR